MLRTDSVNAVPSELISVIDEYVRNLDRLTEKPAVPQFEQRFDIGNVFAEPDWIALSSDMQYTAVRGFGWKPGSLIPIKDRSTNTDLLRDLAADRSLELWTDVEAGSYDVTLHQWDEFNRDQISLYANGEYVGEIHALPDQPTVTTFRVNHTGGTLKLELKDHGGLTKNAVLNALEVKRVAPWAPVVQPTDDRIDPSVIVIMPGADKPVSWLDRAFEIGKPIYDIAKTVATLVAAPAATPLLIAQSAYQTANSALALSAALRREDSTPAWVFQSQIAMNLANAEAGLPLITPARSAVPLTKVESTRFEDLADLFGQVIIIDAGRQLNDGVQPFGAFGDGVSDAQAHRESMERVEKQLVRSINAVSRQVMAQQNATHVDILAVGADFGAIALREAIDSLAEHPLTPFIDHVQLDLINPIAVKDTDKFFLIHPESRPFSLDVTQWVERKTDVPDEFYKSEPLDGAEGGSHLQKLNSIVRQFGPEYLNGERQFRNFSGSGQYVSGEVKAISLSNNERFLAQGTGTGYVSVFDLGDSSRLFDQRLFKENGVTAISFSPDDKFLVVLNSAGRIARIDLTTFKTISTKISGAVNASFGANGSQLLVARKNGEILRLPVHEGDFRPAVVLMNAGQKLTNVWYRLDHIFTLHGTKELRVWDTSRSYFQMLCSGRIFQATISV
jgi:hypothetical protein